MSSKRHDALKALSHDHQHFLLQARNIQWLLAGHQDAQPLQTVVSALLEFWELHGKPHVREEEEVLYKLYLQHAPMAKKDVDRMKRDHQWLEDKIAEINDMPHYENCDPILRSIGQYIKEHVRHEEDVIYEAIQTTLDDAALQQLAAQSAAFRQLHRTVATPDPQQPLLPDDDN